LKSGQTLTFIIIYNVKSFLLLFFKKEVGFGVKPQGFNYKKLITVDYFTTSVEIWQEY